MMGMGIVSDEEFNREIKNSAKPKSEPIPLPTIIDLPNKGRKLGDVNVPESLRKVIGETAVTNGRAAALELAESFNISPSSTSAYTQGAHSTSTYDKRPDREGIKDAKLKVSSKAISKVMQAMSHITKEKLQGSKARDLAAIAKDMSMVHRNMEGDNPDADSFKSPRIIFYAPQFRDERHYDTVVVKEDI
jgi:hypothetical protein